MSTSEQTGKVVRTVSLSFDRLCGFVAIRKAQKTEEVLKNLLIHTLAISADQSITNPKDFQEKIETLFGLKMPESQIAGVLDQLLNVGVFQHAGSTLSITEAVKTEIANKVQNARALEESVKTTWQTEIRERIANIDIDQAWAALEQYLTFAFRQHGIQTISLLDPSVEFPEHYQESLRAILGKALEEKCDRDQRPLVQAAVALFLEGASQNPDRTAFLSRLADSTVSFFSLTAPPEVSQQLRGNLKPLTLFLDTNVLFGLLSLDLGPLVEVAHELIEVIAKHGLPFRVRYHEATERELRSTLDTVKSRLVGKSWAPGVSRVALQLPISTIQKIYHKRNSERPITAESFFQAYDHPDVLIQDMGIKLYRDAGANRQLVYDWIKDYESFLAKNTRSKPYEALDHDMTVLECVHRLRSKSTSSLDAEALLVTTDFLLFKFDRNRARQNGLAIAILPNHLLQLLRPLLPNTPDFDRAFVNAFAIPEFRAMGGGSALAHAKLLETISSYGNVKEKTVAAIFANDLVINGLRKGKSEEEMKVYVESAIALQNTELEERNAALEVALSEAQAEAQSVVSARVRSEKETKELRDQVATISENEKELQKESRDKAARLSEMALREEEERLARQRTEEENVSLGKTLALLQQKLQESEFRAEEERALKLKRTTFVLRLVKTVVASALLIVFVEVAFAAYPFPWFSGHPHQLGIRLALYMLIVSVNYTVFFPDHRKEAITAIVFPTIYLMIQIV